jgi:hypothetical protein
MILGIAFEDIFRPYLPHRFYVGGMGSNVQRKYAKARTAVRNRIIFKDTATIVIAHARLDARRASRQSNIPRTAPIARRRGMSGTEQTASMANGLTKGGRTARRKQLFTDLSKAKRQQSDDVLEVFPQVDLILVILFGPASTTDLLLPGHHVAE